MSRRVESREADVARLGDQARVEAHYRDELDLNELFALCELADELVLRWEEKSEAARAKFLSERPSVLARGDLLASREPSAISPLLLAPLSEAQEAWRKSRRALETLTAR